jgi:hypothetical protein
MICGGNRTCIYCFGLVLVAVPGAAAVSGASWNGRLSDASGKPVADAILLLHPAAGGRDDTTTTTATGKFAFTDIAGGSYEVSLQTGDKEWKAGPLVVKDATPLSFEQCGAGWTVRHSGSDSANSATGSMESVGGKGAFHV